MTATISKFIAGNYIDPWWRTGEAVKIAVKLSYDGSAWSAMAKPSIRDLSTAAFFTMIVVQASDLTVRDAAFFVGGSTIEPSVNALLVA